MPKDVCAYVKCVKNIKRIRVGEGVERALNTVCQDPGPTNKRPCINLYCQSHQVDIPKYKTWPSLD